MEEELRNNNSDEKRIYEIDTQDILKNIDCQKLADLLSNEQFLGKFIKSVSTDKNEDDKSKKKNNTQTQVDMNLPDLDALLHDP